MDAERGRGPVIGIDLGTTYSLVAHLVDGVPTLIPNALGDVLTPSVVAIDAEGRVVVGSAARAIAQHDPRSSVQEFKRDMGTPRQHAFGDRLLGAPALSALVLSSLRRDAEAFLGTAVEEAVITVPAYFGDAQRQATRDAGALAGLRVDRVINEPTAAALAYGLHARGRDQRVIVIDLGGGTFDVTVLEILEGVIEVQASAGDVRLGGLDFDQALVSVVAARSGLTTEIRDEPIAARRAKAACERAKHELSTRELVEIAIPGLSYQGRPVDVVQPLTRVDAEAAWQPLLERMRLPILRGLRDVGLKPRDVDEVLLVGGASRMPCVVKLVAEMFDRLPMRHLQPDEAIAKGAAIQAGLMAGDRSLGDLVVTDIAPFSLGVDIAAIHAGTTVTGMFSPILERGTVLPASRSATFSTLQANQTQILLGIYQGEHSLVRDNTKLGELRVDGLPKRPAGDVRLEVRFSYDANAILEVDVEVLGHDRRESLMIEGHPGRMTPGERATALAALQQLKFHPREALPNVTALARGEALFVELRLSARDELQARLAVLRSALERQAFDDIDDARRALLAFIDHYRNEA